MKKLEDAVFAVSRKIRGRGLSVGTIWSGVCRGCGELFFCANPGTSHCYTRCGVARKEKSKHVCLQCGVVFSVYPSRAKLANVECCSRKCSALYKRGPNSNRWLGGSRTKDGYIRVCSNGIYSLEHRDVVSKRIGRPLMRFESVHHKNGVRDDNRDENLELWTKPQVPGRRVSDLVAWMIKHYLPEIRAAITA